MTVVYKTWISYSACAFQPPHGLTTMPKMDTADDTDGRNDDHVSGLDDDDHDNLIHLRLIVCDHAVDVHDVMYYPDDHDDDHDDDDDDDYHIGQTRLTMMLSIMVAVIFY